MSATFFFACEEKDVTSTNSNIKKTMNNEDTIIGFYNIDEQAFELNFSEEEFARLYKDKVEEDYGIDVNVELVKIDDEQPENSEYYSYLLFKVYNIDDDCLFSNMMELRKNINDDKNVVYYAPFGSTTTLTCEANNCGSGECVVMKNFWGKAIDCTPCEKQGGTCKKTSSSTSIKWTDVAAAVVAIIKLFV